MNFYVFVEWQHSIYVVEFHSWNLPSDLHDGAAFEEASWIPTPNIGKNSKDSWCYLPRNKYVYTLGEQAEIP